MDLVLRDLVGNECYVFIDDIIVYGNTIEEHARRLGHVLDVSIGQICNCNRANVCLPNRKLST